MGPSNEMRELDSNSLISLLGSFTELNGRSSISNFRIPNISFYLYQLEVVNKIGTLRMTTISEHYKGEQGFNLMLLEQFYFYVRY
jgi:hypothetical protein